MTADDPTTPFTARRGGRTLRLLIVGSGFAGVWAALGAARRRRGLRLIDDVDIAVLSPEPFLGVRPRYYEPDLDSARIELDQLLTPVGVEHRRDRALTVDTDRHVVTTDAGDIDYDALIWAAGSRLVVPDLPGAECLHTVDSFDDAQRLAAHIAHLAASESNELSARTVVVVGAGFTGLETAAEMTDRLGAAFATTDVRVVLVERADVVAPEFGPDARRVIVGALTAMGIEVRRGRSVVAVEADRVELDDGDTVSARTVIWTGGVRAIPATASIADEADVHGRLAVDATLRVRGVTDVWAAGDVARAVVDGTNVAMMSCQHAMPQGRYAGYNAVSSLTGRRQRRYEQHFSTTCLDLGSWGALLTTGSDRNQIIATERDAKALKRFINRSVIYPPLGDGDALLKEAKLPRGGKAMAAAAAAFLANSTARNLAIRRGHDGPNEVLARRAAHRPPASSAS